MGFAGPSGLDYAGVEAAARLEGFQLGPGEFRLLRELEDARLEDLAREARRRQDEAEGSGGGA